MVEKDLTGERNSTRTHELIHFNQYDILIGSELYAADQVAEVITQAVMGIQEAANCPDLPLYFNRESSMGTLFVKRKTYSGVDHKMEHRDELATGLCDTGDIELTQETLLACRKVWFARSSVINEMKVAALVNPVVKMPAAQVIAKRHGFESLEYIRPLLTVVDKSNRYKYTVSSFHDMKERADIDTTIEAELVELFSQQGIVANDLEHWHLQVDADDEKKLYLLDTEEYHPATELISRPLL
jgi:hypothetical protein